MDRTIPRKHRAPRGPRPRPPRPADVSAEALIDAVHLLGVVDDADVEHLHERRNLRHRLLSHLTDAINAQREANGLPALSDADRAAIGFPAWSALASYGMREAA